MQTSVQLLRRNTAQLDRLVPTIRRSVHKSLYSMFYAVTMGLLRCYTAGCDVFHQHVSTIGNREEFESIALEQDQVNPYRGTNTLFYSLVVCVTRDGMRRSFEIAAVLLQCAIRVCLARMKVSSTRERTAAARVVQVVYVYPVVIVCI